MAIEGFKTIAMVDDNQVTVAVNIPTGKGNRAGIRGKDTRTFTKGNINTWMPSMDAKSKLAKLGLVEDAFVVGGFREWFADEIKQLILDGELTKVIKLFNHIDPSILGDLAGLSSEEYAFVKAGTSWIVKFDNKK